ncbi:serine/threonine protein kinase [Streptomyces scopuliridis]|uniref:serine/threonine-protein kinase n=1 Tax=Streptomyces scopuliridis TaxID=452529 RepID=UPI002DD9B169|nr:serine/threonine-protein kinase [Streptomyces scopuliridis]WSB33729.1 serine/threonine protein kinase [Streptomyces scopuliridis]
MSGMKIGRLSGDDPMSLGPYRIIGRLGSGGMGRIYLARAAGPRLVAVKTLLTEGPVSDIDRRRFAREVTLAQRVDSAFTARVLDADAGAGRPWMAIEYIPAPSLAELVRTAGQPPASAVRWIGAGVAAALVTLHGEGIVHRDIKPANVLLPLDGPRVIDFGISHAGDITRTGLTLGTIAFTSPEQARGGLSTAASDIYSLGSTLFHLAVGRPPYADDGDALRLLARVSRGELELSGLPRELDGLIRSCLAPAPGDRPQPADVLAQFKSGLVGLPVSDSGSRWLPPRWTALIEEYERQGLALRAGSGPGPHADADADADADAPTADQRTRPVAGPGPTRQYTRAHAGESAADRAAREARQAEAQAQERERERAAQERAARERERAAREHDRAERERAERRAQRERLARDMAEMRAEQELAARERAERERDEARSRARATSAGNATGPTGAAGTGGAATGATRAATPAATPTPTPAKNPSSGGGGWILAFLAVVVLLIWQPWASDDSNSMSSTGGYSNTGISTPSYSYTPSSEPTPSDTDLAFRAVKTGDCVSSHDDGHGGWTDPAPRRVDCDAADAYNRVASAVSYTDGECDADADEETWTNVGEDDVVTTLCLTRKYAPGQCFIAEADGDGIGAASLQTVWGCGADTVPEGYRYVMQITRYEGKRPDGRAPDCRQYAGDLTRYTWWEVDGGTNVICAKAV